LSANNPSHQLGNGADAGGRQPALWLIVRVNIIQALRRLLALREQSRLLTGLIMGFIAGYLALAFYLFYKGIAFAGKFPGFGTLLVERLLFLLFAFLFVMLLFSNIVMNYTNLFRNRETQFLLTMPVTFETVFRWKFIESVILASWAFLFLIAPLLAAFGIKRGVPWHFYPMTTLLVILCIILPGAFGAWIAVGLARHLERRAFQLAAVGSALVLLASAIFWLKPEPLPDENAEFRVLQVLDKLLNRTRFAEMPFLPSYWLSSSVLNWAEGALSSAIFFALFLLSHSMFFGFLTVTQLGRRFYEAFSAVQSRESAFGRWQWFQAWRRRQKRMAWETGLLEKIFGVFRFIPLAARALVVKDLRMFWRDTTQWGQSIMLFGLLGVYIINLRHFTNQLSNPFWVHLVSFLNLAACALNLATLTTRFVFPQFSLEGRRLWILGLCPLSLEQIVKIKYGLACGTSLLATLGLMLLSCQMLSMPLDRLLFFCAAVTIMTFSLNGLAVGIGVLYPNLREDNPGKIVSGFGGTLCLVLSFVYILLSVLFLAAGSPWSSKLFLPAGVRAACWVAFFGMSVVVGWFPMRLAFRRLASFEF